MVRVIIERRVKAGKEITFSLVMIKLRTEAMKQPGFVTSEAWLGKDDQLLSIVISTWLSTELWETWATSIERQVILAELEPLLSCPTRLTVLMHPGEIEVNLGYKAPLDEHLIVGASDWEE